MELLKVTIDRAGYEEREDVIRNVAFRVHSGEWVGLIGANGAGKSTTIKSILGLLKSCVGEIEFGGDKGTHAYIPEHPILYDELTLWEHLELAASVWEMERDVFTAKGEQLLAQFHMENVRDHLPGSFSKGMQQKMMLMIGFLLEPDMYIVDEPFIGLDPRAMKQFIEMMQMEASRGAGILMSTHVLDTAERYCDSFLLMSEGTVVAHGALDEIRQQCGLPGGTLFDCFHSLL